jgi:multimeric flavodoxin WrbA
MKILTIISSGRKQGNTSKIASMLLRRVEEQAKQEGKIIQLEKLFLADYELKHCLGCRTCMDRGEEKCPLKDDLTEIKAKIDEADAVIFGSPVYVGNVSSMMKALIDRLAYICHRQEFYKKAAFVYSTSGGSTNKHTNRTIAGSLLSWGFNLKGTAGFIIKHHDSEIEIEEKYAKNLDKIAKKVYRSVIDKQYLKPTALSLAMFKLQQRERADPEKAHPLDYKYWNENGWKKSEANYYIKHQSSKFRIFLSVILYKTISILFVK